MIAIPAPARRLLAADRRGLAVIEFALILPPLVLLVALIVDIGLCYNARLNTLRGAAAGAMYAFENGGDVTAATADAFRGTISNIVQQGAGSTSPAVTVLVNNVAGPGAADQFYCTSGKPTQWRSTGAASMACGDDTMSAKFVTIRTARTPVAIIPVVAFGARIFPQTATIVVRTK